MKRASRRRLREQLKEQSRQLWGVPGDTPKADDADRIEIVRREPPNQAEFFWAKDRGRRRLFAWLGVSLLLAVSLVLAFLAGFAVAYIYALYG